MPEVTTSTLENTSGSTCASSTIVSADGTRLTALADGGAATRSTKSGTRNLSRSAILRPSQMFSRVRNRPDMCTSGELTMATPDRRLGRPCVARAVVCAGGGDGVLERLIRQRNSLGRTGSAAGQHLDGDAVGFLPEGPGPGCSQSRRQPSTGDGSVSTSRPSAPALPRRDTGSPPVDAQGDHCGQPQLLDVGRQPRFAVRRVDRDDAAVGQQHTEHRRDHRRMVAQNQTNRGPSPKPADLNRLSTPVAISAMHLPVRPDALVLDRGGVRIERQDLRGYDRRAVGSSWRCRELGRRRDHLLGEQFHRLVAPWRGPSRRRGTSAA